MECYLGQLLLVPYTYDPQGWMTCDGRLLNISEYSTLYALLGTAYGGDGQTTFALPDLRGRVPIGKGTSAQFHTNYPFASKGGVETVTLTADTMAAHTHGVQASVSTGSATSPANAAMANGASVYVTNPASTVTLNAASCTTGPAAQAHENLGPYLPLRWIIAVEGIYPQQS